MNEIFTETQDILKDIARELSQANIITKTVQKAPTYDAVIGNFSSGIKLKRSSSDIERHCVKFLTALSNVGGPVADAADMLKEEWTSILPSDINLDYPAQRPRF